MPGRHDVPLRQSYVRVAKRAALMAGRYAHAKQSKRHNRELKFLRTRLGRIIRDIGRKIDGEEALEAGNASKPISTPFGTSPWFMLGDAITHWKNSWDMSSAIVGRVSL